MPSIQLTLPFPPEIEWRDIPGWEGWYQVSNTGLVRRIKPEASTWIGRILIAGISRGYLHVYLSSHGKSSTHRIHKLVILAFKGERPEGMQINHINGIKTDNRPENLEYITPSQNTLHAWHVLNACKSKSGEDSGMAKFTEDNIREIRRRSSAGEKCTYLAREYGVSHSAISMIISRKRWSHIV